MSKRAGSGSWLLVVIVLAYLGLAVLYAWYTPAWQVPDEPAHYNYVRQLAETARVPILQLGDYPHDYLEEIKAQRFPPSLPIDPIRYESHQPPLYYLLAVPVYWLGSGRLFPLRLVSVALGGLLLMVAHAIVTTIFPRRPALALGTVAFVAFVPMHLAMVAGVENDTLAELLLAVVALLAVRHVAASTAPQVGRATWRRLLGMGVGLGLVLVTKTTAYAAVPVALMGVIWGWQARRAVAPSPRRLLGQQLLAVFGPALLMGLPWYVRNVLVYGWPDLTGLRWHNLVVIGQPRTAEWIATNGWYAFLTRFLEFSFKSFWGVFGWMGVFLDNRIYMALGLLTCVVILGLLGWALRGVVWRRAWRKGPVSRLPNRLVRREMRLSTTARQLGLLGVWIGWTVLQYIAYNVTFVQHQGRYLFPALIPLGLAFALGWRETLRPSLSRWLGALLVLIAVTLWVAGWIVGDRPVWLIVISALLGVGFLVRPWLPRRLDGLLFTLPSVGLAALAVVSLFGFIVPGLS